MEVFVALTSAAGNGGIAVVRRSGAGYTLGGVIPLPLGAEGIALTHDGNLPIVTAGAGSIWASVTPDDEWLFVCDETAKQVTVIDLNLARSTGFSQTSIRGALSVGAEPISIVFYREIASSRTKTPPSDRS
jgi:hypothetical protein